MSMNDLWIVESSENSWKINNEYTFFYVYILYVRKEIVFRDVREHLSLHFLFYLTAYSLIPTLSFLQNFWLKLSLQDQNIKLENGKDWDIHMNKKPVSCLFLYSLGTGCSLNIVYFLKIFWIFWTLPVLLQRWCSSCLACVHTLTSRENRVRKIY